MFKTFEGVVREGSEEQALLKMLDPLNLPGHLAVIMDGNGRWAKSRGLSRTEGHKEGAESARKITEFCVRLGIQHLTLYTFSSENWKRPVKEVNTLMEMLNSHLLSQKDLLVDHNIQFTTLGDLGRLPGKLRESIKETVQLSQNHTGLTLHLALNYGGRDEIIHAVKKIIDEGVKSSRINEQTFANYLYDPHLPDPDLMIRTSGETRISNFLLYQIAYTELFFSEVLWPDFRLKELLTALVSYQGRNRRFGKL